MSGLEGLLAGRTLAGRYRVQEVIGRGGMGAVYRARDERLGREIALKVITATAIDPEAAERIRKRFRREAAAAARLPHHPNVVPVYDFGTDETLGIDFLVMELLRGQTLQAVLGRSGRLPAAEAVSVLRRAARGVAVGHRAGLVHRDVKPGNIFLVRGEDGETGVRVLDFGIAKAVDEEDTGTQLTREGGAPHSPAYASPEQIRGLSRLTPASDVFSLGVVGFQALTGKRAFSEAARNQMSLGTPVPVPSARDTDDAIPTEVDGVLRRAMAYDPEERYADASEFGVALREAQEEARLSDALPFVSAPLPGRPHVDDDETVAAAEGPDEGDHTRAFPADDAADDATLAAPDAPGPGDHTLAAPGSPPAAPPPSSVRRRPPRRKRKSRGVFALPLLLLLAALGFAGWYLLVWEEPVPPPPPPEETEVELPDVEDVEPEEPDELQAWALNNDGVTLMNRGRLDEALDHFRRASSISPDVSEYRYNYGNALVRAGEHAEAIRELEAAIRLEPRRANAYALHGQARLALGDTTRALESFHQFLERSTDPRAQEEVERQIEAIEEARAPEPEPQPDPDTALPPPETIDPAEDRRGRGPPREGRPRPPGTVVDTLPLTTRP